MNWIDFKICESLYIYIMFFFYFFGFLSQGVSKKLINLGSPKVFSCVTTVMSHLWWVILGALNSGFVWGGKNTENIIIIKGTLLTDTMQGYSPGL